MDIEKMRKDFPLTDFPDNLHDLGEWETCIRSHRGILTDRVERLWGEASWLQVNSRLCADARSQGEALARLYREWSVFSNADWDKKDLPGGLVKSLKDLSGRILPLDYAALPEDRDHLLEKASGAQAFMNAASNWEQGDQWTMRAHISKGLIWMSLYEKLSLILHGCRAEESLYNANLLGAKIKKEGGVVCGENVRGMEEVNLLMEELKHLPGFPENLKAMNRLAGPSDETPSQRLREELASRHSFSRQVALRTALFGLRVMYGGEPATQAKAMGLELQPLA